MAYDEGLAQRIRETLEGRHSLAEKRMFGGIGFMLQGNVCCGVIKDDLIVRIDPNDYEAALAKAHTRPFDFTGRPMKGWAFIAPPGYQSDEALEDWVDRDVRLRAVVADEVV